MDATPHTKLVMKGIRGRSETIRVVAIIDVVAGGSVDAVDIVADHVAELAEFDGGSFQVDAEMDAGNWRIETVGQMAWRRGEEGAPKASRKESGSTNV